MKPNTRILDYTALVQDGVLTLDDVPQDVKQSVTKWVRYLSGVTDNGMIEETKPVNHEGEEVKVPVPSTLIKKAGE